MSSSRLMIVLLAALLLATCQRPTPSPPQARSADTRSGPPILDLAPWPPRDTFTLTVSKPVVIAVASVPQGTEDVAVEDAGFYLDRIQDSLTAMGVEFQATNAGLVRLHTDSGWSSFTFPNTIGYLLATPGRRPKRLFGVQTDLTLVPELRAYLTQSP